MDKGSDTKRSDFIEAFDEKEGEGENQRRREAG
jgi:hypothetical protein